MVQGVSAYYFISCACSHFQLVLEIDEALEVNFISQSIKIYSKDKKQVAPANRDYKMILFYKKLLANIIFKSKDTEELVSELKNARLVQRDELPGDVRRFV